MRKWIRTFLEAVWLKIDTFGHGNFHHGNANHVFGRLGSDLEILGESSPVTQPGQGAFDDPSFGLHLKPILGFLHDIDVAIKPLLDKVYGRPAITLIGCKGLDRWIAIGDLQTDALAFDRIV